MNRQVLLLATPVLMTLGIALLATGCAKQEAAQHVPQITRVRTAAAVTGPAIPAVDTSGIVATKDEIRLSFKTGGIVQAVHVQEGQTVTKGQRLAEIELTEVDSQVDQARLMADKSTRDLERGEKLYSDRLISLGQLQDLRTQAEMYTAQLKSAQFNRGHSVIASPSDGVVLRKLVQDKELVSPGQPVLIIGSRSSGYVVRAALADREIVHLRLGDAATIVMDAYPGRTLAGTLAEISGAADTASGLFPVEVRFTTPPTGLASGLVARLNLQAPTSRAGTLTYVPIAAVVEGDKDRASVFVIDGNRAKRRAVRVAFIAPQAVALIDGLTAGERVITDGALYLEDGEQIEIAPDQTEVADAPAKAGSTAR